MGKNLLLKLISATNAGVLNWETTISPYEFMATFENQTYTICNKNQNISIFKLCDDKNVKEEFPKEDVLYCSNLLYTLFNVILKSNNEMNETFNKYIKMKKESDNSGKSVSVFKIMQRLMLEKKGNQLKVKIKEGSTSFYYATEPSLPTSQYVQPPMSQIPTSVGMTKLSDAQVVFVSAPGATGKTAMSEYISNKLDIPILNLGKHDSVGANTISGVIMRFLENDDIFLYSGGMKTGEYSMIIDGLDEAIIRITQSSFEAFIQDIAFFAEKAQGIPFVIFGRTVVMDDAILLLEDLNIKVVHLQIEPFTIEKAKDFIDNHIDVEYRKRFEKQYKDVRDYIIEQIGGFFRNESEMNRKIFERFIGYAPVLLSITTLLSVQSDYHKLLEDLKQSKKQKMELLVDIVERILKREKCKIQEEVLSPLFDNNRSSGFKNDMLEIAGTDKEQCLRILLCCLGRAVNIPLSNELAFDEKYNEKMNQWIEGHPFIDVSKRVFHNVVFESFAIAKLINDDEYKDVVLEYLNKTNLNSYLLLDVYTEMSKDSDGVIDYHFFPHLYSSFKSLDHPQDVGITEIASINDDLQNGNNIIECNLSFGRASVDYEYDFIFRVNSEDVIALPSKLSAFTLDAPLRLETDLQKTEIQSPSTICCLSLKLCSKDLILSKQKDSPIVIECDKFDGTCKDGSVPLITNRSNDKQIMEIFTNDNVDYPFFDYKKNIEEMAMGNEQIIETYKKLRRLILMFRSHNRGVLARCRSKIDSRIAKNPLGVNLVNALKQKEVIYQDNIMYYINPDKQAEVLGLKYDDIRSSKMNEKTIAFLKSIKN